MSLECSPRLVAQVAAEAGVTELQVRLAICMHACAAGGRPFTEAVRVIGRSRPYAQRIARAWLIDFPDYRPFARRDPRPAPIGRLA